jgi:hypothetical protein
MRFVEGNGNEDLSCKMILQDVSEIDVLINSQDGIGVTEEEDVKLKEDDMLWVEIAETPQRVRNKLYQLERAYRHFKSIGRDDCLPKVAVICLNGEQGLFRTANKHLKGAL